MASTKNNKSSRVVVTRTNARKRNLSGRNDREKKMICAIIALAILLIGSIGVAVAAFSTDLEINGTATVKSSVWSVRFANLKPVVTNGNGASEITAPTIQNSASGNEMTVIKTYDVELKDPGDSVEYTFDVVNDGDMDAKLAAITINTGANLTCTSAAGQAVADKVCSKLNYTITHADGSALTVGESLPAGTNNTKTLKLKLEFDSSATADDLPSDDVAVSNLGVVLSYEQDTSN